MNQEYKIWDDKLKRFSYFDLSVASFHLGIGGEVQQFSGLLDRNKEKIFEGDIITPNEIHRFFVEFRSGCFWAGNSHLYLINKNCRIVRF